MIHYSAELPPIVVERVRRIFLAKVYAQQAATADDDTEDDCDRIEEILLMMDVIKGIDQCEVFGKLPNPFI